MSKTWQVLVLDDDFRVAGIHADIVRATPGFTLLDSVRSVGQAQAIMSHTMPDLLLADVYLPDGDGIDLVHSTRVDAFVLSAADGPATVRRALQSGVLAYLVKPFSARILSDRLDRYARFRHITSGSRGLSQEKIDRAMSIMYGNSDPENVSKNATEDLVLNALKDGEASAAEVAELAGVSRATAQRRLVALASNGIVDVRLRYGATGRPEHLYSQSRK